MDTQTQLATSLTRYLKSLSGRNLSEHTATAYRTDLLQFLTWVSENDLTVDSPTQITRTHILNYLTHLAELGRSGVTRVRKLAAIREYCKFLIDEQSIHHSPAENIIRPKQERKQRVFLRVDEYMRLLNAAVGNSRDYAILQLLSRYTQASRMKNSYLNPDSSTWDFLLENSCIIQEILFS